MSSSVHLLPFDTKFIADDDTDQRQCHLLIRHGDESEEKYVSVVDNDNFPRDQYRLTPPSDLSRIYFVESFLGSSHGLLCYYGYENNAAADDDDDDHTHDDADDDEDCDDNNYDDNWTMVAVIWNPYIKRSVRIVVPKVLHPLKSVAHVGFGVCPGTRDPKLVKIVTSRDPSAESDGDVMPWQVEVYALSSGVWRSSSCNKLPHKSISLSWNPVVINGIIYWLATYEKRGSADEGGRSYLIIAFDLTIEEFEEIYLPETLVEEDACLQLANLRGSLALINDYTLETAETSVCDVWVMKNHSGVPKSFTKLYSLVMAEPSYLLFCEFRKNGDPILKSVDADSEISTLKLYEPCSKRFTDLGFSKVERLELSPFVISYTETLLLNDNPDSVIIQE